MRCNVRQEGAKVRVNIDNHTFLELDPRAALEFARMLKSVARQADEWAHAERIVADSALLMRTGAPCTLSSHPTILDAARSEAAWNRDLRRYLPGGVKARGVFGTPNVVKHAGEKPPQLEGAG